MMRPTSPRKPADPDDEPEMPDDDLEEPPDDDPDTPPPAEPEAPGGRAPSSAELSGPPTNPCNCKIPGTAMSTVPLQESELELLVTDTVPLLSVVTVDDSVPPLDHVSTPPENVDVKLAVFVTVSTVESDEPLPEDE